MPERVAVFYRDIPAGSGLNSVGAAVKRHVDDGVVVSGSTAGTGTAAGKFTATRAQVGYPGPIYVQFDGTQVKRDSGMVTTQVGPWWLDDAPDVFGALGIGPLSGLAVSADGTSMSVAVAAGKGVFSPDGLPFVLDAAVQVGPVAPADLTNPRIDRLTIRARRRGHALQGKYEWVILTGTPAASPTPPALVQESAGELRWDFSLAQIRVEAGATTIAASKVTDERYSAALGQAHAFAWPSGITPGDLFVANASGQLTRLPIGGASQYLKVVSGAPAWDALTPEDIDANVSAAEFGHLNGVTSAIQPQIDGKAATAHTHAGADIASGTVGTARLGSGTASSSTFLRGDQTWATPSSSVGAHTHGGVLTRMGSATKSYASTGVTSGGSSVASFTLNLSVGITYEIFAVAMAQGHMGSGQAGNCQLGVKVGANAVSWGSEVGTELGERPLFAFGSDAIFVASGDITIQMWGRSTGAGTANILSGVVFAVAVPRETAGVA